MRFRGIASLAAAAIVLTGCGGNDPSRQDAEGQGLIANPRQPVQTLLRERAKHLQAGDVEGYLKGLSPEARAFEEPIARTALTLGLDRIDMTVGEATISDDGLRFRKALVTLQVALKGLPLDNPFKVRFFYAIDRQPDKTFLVTKSVFAEGEEILEPPIWATGPVEITRSEHFVVLTRPGVPGAAEAAEQAEAGLARLLPKLTLEADDRFLFVLAKDAAEYKSIGGDDESIAYASSNYVQVPGRLQLFRPEERYMAANRDRLFRSASVNLENGSDTFPVSTVIQHEVAHLVLSRFTRSCMNEWVIEGGAMLLSGEDRSGEWRTMVALDELDGLVLNPPPGGEGRYAFANAAVLYLVQREGAATFFDFYQNFKTLPDPTTTCSGRIKDVRSKLDERLLRRYYGLTVEELEGFAREYIKAAAGTP